MKMTFRWYGENDPVTLRNIAQIPCMSGIVSAVYDVPVGQEWSLQSIMRIKELATAANLEFEVVESVPVHEDIKLGKPTRDGYIDVYCKNIENLAKAGIKVICYNFMPVFDWLRSSLTHENADGSTSLIYREEDVLAMDPNTKELTLPGWDSSYTKEGLRALLDDYKSVDEEKLWDNIAYFINGIMPTCIKYDVRMAIHPDDPPWGIFGLPRIITNKQNLRRFLDINDCPNNGLTLCTGSLGVNPQNDLADMIKTFGSRDKLGFVHLRNIKHVGHRGFNETAHPTQYGSLDMYAIVKALSDIDYKLYVRPDHGRFIWGETGRPGYGLYDRALGAVYISGLWEAVRRGR